MSQHWGSIQSSIFALEKYKANFLRLVDTEQLQSNELEQLIETLNGIINAKKVEHFRANYLFKHYPEIPETLEIIVQKWSLFRSTLARIFYSGIYDSERVAGTIKLLSDICNLEQQMLDKFWREQIELENNS